MSRMMLTAGNELVLAGSPREIITLITSLWDIECRHPLGEISRAEYLRTVRALRSGFENGYRKAKPKGKIDER
jgi:hypothetical protein